MDNKDDLELRDENIYPDDKVLSAVLGDTYKIYQDLLDLFDRYDLTWEWRYYRDGKAWLCKVQKKKKTIVWMSAWKGYMQAAIYYPVRLLDKMFELEIRETQKQKIRSTKNVGKSKPCTFELRDEDILGDFEKVMLLKMKSK